MGDDAGTGAGPRLVGSPGDDGLTEAVFDGAADALLVLSEHGDVLDANPVAREAFGDDVVGSLFGIPSSPGAVVEVDLWTAQGPRTAEMQVGEARVDGARVLVASLRDITRRKEIEQGLRDFVSYASHEVRSPLFAISGFTETLDESWDELTDDERRRYVTIVRRQARRLTSLSDDLLVLSRLDDEDAVGPAPDEVTIGEAFDGVEPGLSDHVEVRGSDVVVHVDPQHLLIVLDNLLVNAHKYGQAPVGLHARVVGDVAEVRVVDHGDGVPVGFRPRMFDRFAREPAAARRQPGTGLGLPISRGLVESNGGSLTYEETAGGGATFVVTLPAG